MRNLRPKIKAAILSLSLFLINPQLAFAESPIPRAASFFNGPKSGLSLGSLISQIFDFVFAVAGIIAFVWALIGVFQYITAGGNKEGLAKARARITWAFIGLLFLIISFSISKYAQEIFHITTPTAPPVSRPTSP